MPSNDSRRLAPRAAFTDEMIEAGDLALKHNLGVSKLVQPGDSYYVLRAALPLIEDALLDDDLCDSLAEMTGASIEGTSFKEVLRTAFRAALPGEQRS